MTLEKAKVLIAYFHESDDVYLSATNLNTMGVMHTNYPFHRSNVMRSEKSVTRDGLDLRPWHYDVNLQLGQSSTRNMFQVEVFPNIVGIFNALAEVQISTKEYGKGSIEAILLDFYCGRAPIARGKSFDILTSFPTNEERNQDRQEVENDRIHRSIKLFSDLISTNISFLKGEIYATPYALGPISQETLPLLQDLIEINKFGFISTGGQPAVCEYYYKSPLLESQVDFSNPVLAKLSTEYPDGYYFADEQMDILKAFSNETLPWIS